MQSQLAAIELLIVILLLIAAVVAWLAEYVRIPYTVGLVVVGVLITVLVPRQETLEPELARELILLLLLPPLVFEAALHIEISDFRANLPTILTFAVPGVLLTTALVGALLAPLTGLPLTSLLVFGALIAATDPVAVIAIFRDLGVSKRLGLLLEGESLLNDATAIVVFGLALEFALHPADFSVLAGIGDFVRVVSVGLVIGLGLGWVAYRLISQIDDYLIETALSAVLAYGVYLLAERLHASGVLAVVAAGIMMGNRGTHYGMSYTTRNVLIHIWEFLVFLANSFVFLLIGLQVDLQSLADGWLAIVVAIGVVLAVRAVSVYGLSVISNRFARLRVPSSWQTVMWWGGLRGGIALALVLTLPRSLAGRDTILVMTFGVVLFTLVVQATTIKKLLDWLGLLRPDPSRAEYERRRARLAAARSAEKHVESQYRQGLLTRVTYEQVIPGLQSEIEQYSDQVREALTVLPDIRDDEVEATRREILQAKRNTLRTLHRDGIISNEVYDELREAVDAELTEG